MPEKRDVHTTSWAVLRFMLVTILLPFCFAKFTLVIWIPSPTNFYVGWLSVAIFVACLAYHPIDSSKERRTMFEIPALLISGVLFIGATVLARFYFYNPSGNRVLGFLAAANAFFLFNIGWVLLFPFESQLATWPPRAKVVWKVTSAVIAVCLASLVLVNSWRLYVLNRSAGFRPNDILIYHGIAVQGAVLVFFFLVFRAAWPPAFSKLMEAFGRT